MLAIAIALVCTALALAAPHSAKVTRVAVKDNFFTSKTVHVASGGRVTWVWRGDLPHNVSFRHVPRGASKKPRARTRTTGHFTRRFTAKGRYRYVCTIHEDDGMKGTVVVR